MHFGSSKIFVEEFGSVERWLNACTASKTHVYGNGGRGNGTIPLLASFVGEQVLQKDVGAVTVGDFNNSLSSVEAYVKAHEV